ncbi:hypothetical protein M0R04_15200 [Candidatus Dojkabacteria bacterium]|jgi:predicted HTH domain antitoxin|nr:hypothetical protein [Candidatus Dojkabacteria bacterium]
MTKTEKELVCMVEELVRRIKRREEKNKTDCSDYTKELVLFALKHGEITMSRGAEILRISIPEMRKLFKKFWEDNK